MWGSHAVSEADRIDAEAAGRLFRRAWPLLAASKGALLAAIGSMVAYTATVVGGPLLVRYGIDHGVADGDVGALNLAVAGYVLLVVAGFLADRGQVVALGRVGERFLRDLRVKVFDHIQSLSLGFFEREKAGVLVSRMTSDVDALSEVLQFGLRMFVVSGLVLVWTLALLVVLSWELTLVCLVALPIVVAASVRFQRQSNQAYLQVRERVAANLSRLQEGLSGVRVIQAFAREDAEHERFRQDNERLYGAHVRTVRVSTWYFPLVEFAGAAATAAVVGTGGWLVSEGRISIGTVAAFVLLLSNLFDPIQQMSQLFNTVQAAGAALSKLFGLLDTRTEVPERPGAVDLPARGELRVEGVSFSYRPTSRRVLEDVDLVLAPGERLALVGPTGAGKSTLAKLAGRLYDPSEGRVTFGGVDLRDATLRSLRRRIVLVPQEGHLFSGSIRENVRLARAGATDADVERALATVGALERFAALEDGLDTEVRERGSRLSAGERQLVALARAALVDPAVLVLDEATSNLDPGTEAEVEEAMESLMRGRTTVVVAHRLSTAERADRVGVVAEGRLAELGPPAELVAAGGRYAELHASWVRGLAAL